MRETGSILEGLKLSRIEEAFDYAAFDNDELFKRKSSKGTVVKDTYYCDVNDAPYTADEWKKAGGKVKGKELYIPKGLKVEVYRFSGQTAVKWKNIDIDWYEEDTPAEVILFVESAKVVDESMTRMDKFDLKVDGFTYEVGFYQDTKTHAGVTQITRSSSYDLTDYHYAICDTEPDYEDGPCEFKLCLNGKVLDKVSFKFNPEMRDYTAIAKKLYNLDKKAGLSARIDRT